MHVGRRAQSTVNALETKERKKERTVSLRKSPLLTAAVAVAVGPVLLYSRSRDRRMTSALIEFLLNRRNNKADVTICERDNFDSPKFFEASDRQFNGDMDALHNCNARARALSFRSHPHVTTIPSSVSSVLAHSIMSCHPTCSG